jgi:hypothetical protein
MIVGKSLDLSFERISRGCFSSNTPIDVKKSELKSGDPNPTSTASFFITALLIGLIHSLPPPPPPPPPPPVVFIAVETGGRGNLASRYRNQWKKNGPAMNVPNMVMLMDRRRSNPPPSAPPPLSPPTSPHHVCAAASPSQYNAPLCNDRLTSITTDEMMRMMLFFYFFSHCTTKLVQGSRMI